MQHRVEVMAIVLIGLSVSMRIQAEEVLPEPGLLEYLGNLVEDDGNYVDPLDMTDFQESLQTLSREQTDNPSDETITRSARRADAEQPLFPTSSEDQP